MQARRVAITPAKNQTFGATKWDGTAVLQPCKARPGVAPGSVASADAPRWQWKNTTVAGPAKYLYITACDESDALQQWSFGARPHPGQLRNVAMGTCLDASGSPDPASLATCSAAPSQNWTLNPTDGRLSTEGMHVCLSVWGGPGPDVALAYCKTPGAGDGNEDFSYDPATKLLATNSSGSRMCVAAQKPPPGGLLSTVIDGKEFCLVQQVRFRNCVLLAAASPACLGSDRTGCVDGALCDRTAAQSNVEGGISGEPCPTDPLTVRHSTQQASQYCRSSDSHCIKRLFIRSRGSRRSASTQCQSLASQVRHYQIQRLFLITSDT